MSRRPSTAQEILDAEGWVPYYSSLHHDIGSVVPTDHNRMGIPTDCLLVIVGTTTIEETNTLLARHNYGPAPEGMPFWYKVVAE